MPPTTRSPRQRVLAAALLLAIAVPVVLLWAGSAGDLLDRRPSYTARFTADELRERPDITEVLPAHGDATHAVLQALADTADVTWQSGDVALFTHVHDGKDEQVVDGLPVLRWRPDAWTSDQPTSLEDADIERLGQAFRQALEPLGYSVSTTSRSTARNPHKVGFVARGPHDESFQLFDDYGSDTLRLIVMTGEHLYRSDTCSPDPLTCFPPVQDPAAGL